MIAIFLFWEAKVASHPLVPFRIFRSRALSAANAIMVLVGGVFFAMWYFLTYYFQLVLGYGPVKAGLAFVAMAIGIIVGAQISSRLIAKTGVRPLLQIGATLATLGFLLALADPADSCYWGHVIVPAFVTAFAMGILFSPLAIVGDLRCRPSRRRARVGRPQHGASGGWLARPGRISPRSPPTEPHSLSAQRLAEASALTDGLSASLSDLRRDHVVRARADRSSYPALPAAPRPLRKVPVSSTANPNTARTPPNCRFIRG